MVAFFRKPGRGAPKSVKDVLAQVVNHVLALYTSGAESFIIGLSLPNSISSLPMPLDLRDWLDQIDSLGLLRKVRSAHWEHEVGAIADLNVKRNKHTLLFDEIKDSPKGFRVLTGALVDSKRFALTLGQPPTLTDMEVVKLLKDNLHSGQKTQKDYSAKFVDSAPLFENVMEGDYIDLYQFPTPKWF